MIHNLTAGADAGLHHLGDGLHPARRQGRARDARGQDPVARRHGRQGLPGLRRHPGHGAQRARHLPRRRAQRLRGRPSAQPLGRRPRRHARRAPRATCTPAACGPTSRSRAHGRTVERLPLARALLRARGRRVVGRVDDARRRPTGAWRSRRATCSRSRAPTTRGRTSWYESMAIMPLAMTVAPAGGVDPFTTNTAVKGVLTHGHLPENDHHGGAPGIAARRHQAPRRPALAAPSTSRASSTGRATCPPPGAARPPAGRQPRPAADLRQRRRRAEHLPHHHRMPRAVHGDDGHRLPAGQRPDGVRLGRARLRARRLHAGRQPQAVADSGDPDATGPTRTSAASIRSCAAPSA